MRTLLCKKWKEFLHKIELFLPLAKDLIIIPSSTLRIVCTVNNDVLLNDPFLSTKFIIRCDHKDERHNVVCVQSVDTDVVIVTASFF